MKNPEFLGGDWSRRLFQAGSDIGAVTLAALDNIAGVTDSPNLRRKIELFSNKTKQKKCQITRSFFLNQMLQYFLVKIPKYELKVTGN